MAKELNKHVVAISEHLNENLTMDAMTGAASGWDHAFDNTLPEGITPEIVKTVDTHRAHFAAAVVNTYGTNGAPIMAANPDLRQISIDVPMGHKDSLHVSVTGMIDPGEGKEKKYGDVLAVYTSHAGVAGSQMKTAMQLVAEAADRAYNGEEVVSE